jgi:hypothetical protein
MSTPELLPSRRQIVSLFIVWAVFCISVPIEVARELVHRGERGDLYLAAMLLVSAVVSGGVAWLVFRRLDKLEDAVKNARR